MLLEGNSIRSTERLTGTNRNTIMAALVEAGEKCRLFLDRTLRNLTVNDVEVDENMGLLLVQGKGAGASQQSAGNDRRRLLLHRNREKQ